MPKQEKISYLDLEGKNQSVDIEDYEFQNRVEVLLQTSFAVLVRRDSNAGMKLTDFFIDYHYEAKNFSIANLLEEIKPVFMEKHEFENRDKSLKTAS